MDPIFQKFRERKLVQWALAYLAGAFALFTALQALGEPWGLTDGFLRGVQAVLALGFFITLTLAWYHGEQGRQRVSGPELLIIASLLTVGALIGRLFLGSSPLVEQPSTSTDAAAEMSVPQLPSLAVLPFDPVEDTDRAFADGIHDEIMTQLGKIRSIDLRSRTSVGSYRETPKNMREIGQELDVRYVVEGTVRGDADRVRINIDLFEADSRLWGDSFDGDRTAADVLALQREIALQVATRLGAQVSSSERASLDVEAPRSLAAYERYLEGLSWQRAVEGVGPRVPIVQAGQRAIAAFQEAIELEPGWAPPVARLGSVHHWLASAGIDREANFRRSRTLVDSALALDSLDGGAWLSHGFLLHRWERDLEAAERAYEHRRRLTGRGGGAALGLLYWSMGRWADAVPRFQASARANPVSRTVQHQLGVTQFCAGQFDAAVDQLEMVKEMQGWSGDPLLTLAYFHSGREGEASAELAALSGRDVSDAMMALIYASLGLHEEAESRLDVALGKEPTRFRVRSVAPALLRLEGPEPALDYLERAAAAVPRSLDYVDCLPEVRELKGNPRYEALMERLGFPGRGS